MKTNTRPRQTLSSTRPNTDEKKSRNHRKRHRKIINQTTSSPEAKKRASKDTVLTSAITHPESEITLAYQIFSDCLHAYQNGQDSYPSFLEINTNPTRPSNMAKIPKHLSDDGKSKTGDTAVSSSALLGATNPSLFPSTPFSTLLHPQRPIPYLSHEEKRYLETVRMALQRDVQSTENQIHHIDQTIREEKQANTELRKLRKQFLSYTVQNRIMEQTECTRLQKTIQEQEAILEKTHKATEFLRNASTLFHSKNKEDPILEDHDVNRYDEMQNQRT